MGKDKLMEKKMFSDSPRLFILINLIDRYR